MRENLEKAQARQQKWYDKKHLPAPEYNTLEDVAPGRAMAADKVMLNQHNIKTKRPTEKLDHKYFGPFVVKRKVGQRAYELELPSRMSIHPVFYVRLLEPYHESANPTRKQDPPISLRLTTSKALSSRKSWIADGTGQKGQISARGSSSTWLSGQAMGQRRIVGNHTKSLKEQRRRC